MSSDKDKCVSSLIDWSSPIVLSADKPLIPVPSMSDHVLESVADNNPFDAVERQIVKNDPFDVFNTNITADNSLAKSNIKIDEVQVCKAMLDNLTINEVRRQMFKDNILVNIHNSKCGQQLDENCSNEELFDCIAERIQDCMKNVLRDYTNHMEKTVLQSLVAENETNCNILVNVSASNQVNSSEINVNYADDEYIEKLSKEEISKYISKRIGNCMQNALKKYEYSGDSSTKGIADKLISSCSPIFDKLQYKTQLSDVRTDILSTSPIIKIPYDLQHLTTISPQLFDKLKYKPRLSSDGSVSSTGSSFQKSDDLLNMGFVTPYNKYNSFNSVENSHKEISKNSTRQYNSFDSVPSSHKKTSKNSTRRSISVSLPLSIDDSKHICNSSLSQVPTNLTRSMSSVSSLPDDKCLRSNNSECQNFNCTIHYPDISSIVPYWVSADNSSDDGENDIKNQHNNSCEEFLNFNQNVVEKQIVRDNNTEANLENNLIILPTLTAAAFNENAGFRLRKPNSTSSKLNHGPLKALLPLRSMTKKDNPVSPDNKKFSSMKQTKIMTPKCTELHESKLLKPVAASTPECIHSTNPVVSTTESPCLRNARRSLPAVNVYEKTLKPMFTSPVRTRPSSPDSTSDTRNSVSPVSRYSQQQRQSIGKSLLKQQSTSMTKAKSVSHIQKLTPRKSVSFNEKITVNNSKKSILSKSPLANTANRITSSIPQTRCISLASKERMIASSKPRKGKENVSPRLVM